MITKTLLILAIALAISCNELIYNPILGSNMVLQRDSTKTQLWGKSSEIDSTIEVTFLQNDKPVFSQITKSVDGKWKLFLNSMPAGGPYIVTISEKETGKIEKFNNIYFGDVYLCSGESNMEWSLTQVFNSSEEIKDANYPLIRLFQVEK
jgi:sialate O-acetylesterase